MKKSNRVRRSAQRRVAISLAAAAGLTVGATVALADDGWQWSLTPYMWATDISETLTLDGEIVGGSDTKFEDLVDKIEASAQLHFEGVRDRWGMFADLTYIEVKDSQTGEFGFLVLDADIEESVIEAGALYRPGGASGRLDVLFGARLLSVDEDYRLRLDEIELGTSTIDEDYLDALVGLRYHIPLSHRWLISLRGDLSTGGTDLVWSAQGLVGWRFGANRNSGVFLGYRYRDMSYTKGDNDVDKTLSGFGVAVKIGF